METLRLVVKQNGKDLLEAQLLELDIVVAAKDEDGLINELRHALEAHYYIAKAMRRTPFVQLLNTVPKEALDSWNESNAKSMGQLFLAEEIAIALASVLRATNSLFKITGETTQKRAA